MKKKVTAMVKRKPADANPRFLAVWEKLLPNKLSLFEKILKIVEPGKHKIFTDEIEYR